MLLTKKLAKMTWEQKTEMIKSSNQDDFQKFKEIVLENIEKFDAQAWDMFFNCAQFIPDEFVKEISFWRQVWSFYLPAKELIEKDTSFRTVMRTALLETLMEDWELNNIATKGTVKFPQVS